MDNAKVEPKEITMNAQVIKIGDRRSNTEHMVLALKASVTNDAFLGGEILPAVMDVYVTIDDKDVKVYFWVYFITFLNEYLYGTQCIYSRANGM